MNLISNSGKWYIAGAMLLLLIAAPVWGNDQEREKLTLLLEQLRNVEALARQSQTMADENAGHSRYRFDYLQLQKDLRIIREGIEFYLTPRRAQPRAVPEFKAQYTVGENDEPTSTQH